MRGDFELARKRVTRARDMLTELGGSVLAASTSIDAAEVELLAGDPVWRAAARDYAYHFHLALLHRAPPLPLTAEEARGAVRLATDELKRMIEERRKEIKASDAGRRDKRLLLAQLPAEPRRGADAELLLFHRACVCVCVQGCARAAADAAPTRFEAGCVARGTAVERRTRHDVNIVWVFLCMMSVKD